MSDEPELELSPEATEKHRAAFQAFVKRMEPGLRAKCPGLPAAEAYAVIAFGLYVVMVESQQEIAELKDEIKNLQSLGEQ